MNSILLTAIGGDIGQAVASVIRSARPEIKIIGVDMNARHGGSLFVDHFVQIPPATSSSYFEVFKETLANYAVDAILPISEVELEKFLEFDDQFEGVPLIWCGKSALEIGLNKFKTYEFLKSINIEVPWTVLAKSGPPKEFPCIMKAVSGSGSKAVFAINNQLEADFYRSKPIEYIYQELLLPADQEVTCAIYRTLDGRITVLQMLRQLVGGLTGWAEVICDPRVESMCSKLAEGLNLRGSINVQLRITSNGPRIFEINPRFSSTVHMRHLLGFTDVIWAISELEGKNVSFPRIKVGQKVVKKQVPVMLK